MNSNGTDSEWSSCDSVASHSSGVSHSRSVEDIASELPFEHVPLDRLPIEQQIVNRNDKYDIYRRENPSSSTYFGLICKYPLAAIFVVMGDVVHNGQIFVCATLVDPNEYPDSNIDAYVTLLSKGGSNDGGEEPFEEYVYETINDFITRSMKLWESKGQRKKVTFEGMKKLLGAFKTEMNAGKTSSILSVHLAKKITDLTDENPQDSLENQESERENGGPSVSKSGAAANDDDNKNDDAVKPKRAAKQQKAVPPVVLRPQSSRDAAKNKAAKYTPESIEPTKKKSAVAGVQSKPVKSAAGSKARSKSVGSKASTSSSSWSGSSYGFDDSPCGYYDDDSSYYVENNRMQANAPTSRNRNLNSTDLTGKWSGDSGRNKAASADDSAVVTKLQAEFAEFKRQSESREADMVRQLSIAQQPASATPAPAASQPVFEEGKLAVVIATAVAEAIAASNKSQASAVTPTNHPLVPAAQANSVQLVGSGGVQYPNPCGGLPGSMIIMPPSQSAGPATLDPNLAAFLFSCLTAPKPPHS